MPTRTASHPGHGPRWADVPRRSAAWVPMRLPSALPLHPLLFAAYPVLFLYAENLADVPAGDVVAPFGRVLIFAAAALALGTVLLRDPLRAAIPVSAGTVAFFTFGHVAGMLAPSGVGRDVQQLVWLTLVGLSAVLAVRLPDVRRLTGALNVVGVVLVLFALSSIVPFNLQATARASSGPGPPDATGPGGRDIYWLVFDRYGSSRSLDLRYGAHGDLLPWLTERGFLVAPDSHANYVRTSLSMAATLDLAYLDDVAARMGRDAEDLSPVHGLLQDHRVGRYLRGRGYRYFHVGSWFGPTRSAHIADVNRRWEEGTDFEANLYQTTAWPLVIEDMDVKELPPEDLKHREAALVQFQALDAIRAEPGPKFVLAHVLLPHDPYVFDERGRYVPEDVQKATPIPELFAAQLAYTNARIREIVQPLLDLPEERRPIIVIQADEGPYPEGYERDKVRFDWERASSDELEIKFGILNAMYLPGLDPEPLPPSMSSVNTFRLLFARVFGEDLPLLPDRTYASRSYERPYDLVDVTERLPRPADGSP
jgi:hypothetical protein